MTPSSQFLFIYDLPSGRASRAHHLQRSKARSHAASVGHLRLKSRRDPDHDDPSAITSKHLQVGVPFRVLKVPPSQPFSGDRSSRAPSATSFPYLSKTTQALPELSLAHEGFPGLRTDPFSCIPTGGDGRVESAIDFISQVIGFGNDILCYVFDVTNVHHSFLATLRNDTFFDAGIGVVQLLREQIRSPGSQPSAQTLKHRGLAIGKILNKLSGPSARVDDITIFAMIFLAALEKGLRNPVAHDLHKRNIAKVVADRGGLQQLPDDSMLKGYLLHYDVFWAMETGKTMFPGHRREYEQRYPIHPFPSELWSSITKLPAGFQKLVTECVICFDILSILSRLTHISRLGYHNRLEFIKKTRKMGGSHNDFWEACPCLGIVDDLSPDLEQLLSLTMICYSFTAFSSNYYPSAFRGSRHALTKKISSYAPKSQAEEDCLIWMWVIAIDSWRTSSGLPQPGLALLFKLQSRLPALRSLSAVNAIVRQFLWPREFSIAANRYWEDLVKKG
jgi:hypothetical protein